MRRFTTLLIATLFICFCSHHASAQSQPGPLAACGNPATSFEVSRGEIKDQTDPPAPGKATLYIIEFYGLGDTGRLGRPLLKQGLDGEWVGATQGITYISASIAPGEHHLCTVWQDNGEMWQNAAFYNFHAEAGQRYYVLAQVHTKGWFITEKSHFVAFQPVSDDEGRFLVSEAARSISKPKR